MNLIKEHKLDTVQLDIKDEDGNVGYDSQVPLAKQAGTTDKAERTKLIEEIQAKVGADLSTLPLLQGAQVAVVGKDVKGADKTLDASFKFRYAALSK